MNLFCKINVVVIPQGTSIANITTRHPPPTHLPITPSSPPPPPPTYTTLSPPPPYTHTHTPTATRIPSQLPPPPPHQPPSTHPHPSSHTSTNPPHTPPPTHPPPPSPNYAHSPSRSMTYHCPISLKRENTAVLNNMGVDPTKIRNKFRKSNIQYLPILRKMYI